MNLTELQVSSAALLQLIEQASPPRYDQCKLACCKLAKHILINRPPAFVDPLHLVKYAETYLESSDYDDFQAFFNNCDVLATVLACLRDGLGSNSMALDNLTDLVDATREFLGPNHEQTINDILKDVLK